MAGKAAGSRCMGKRWRRDGDGAVPTGAEAEAQLPAPALPLCQGLAAFGAAPRPHCFPVASQYVGRKDVGLEGKIIFFLYLLLVLSCCTVSRGASTGPLHPARPG